jgi:uncharacterized protein YcbK (DUF882 family)
MEMNYFSDDELRCQCGCGQLKFDPVVRQALNAIRKKYGKPMIVTSGYRCPAHPIEAKKAHPGEHTTGMCVDIACHGFDAAELTKLAMDQGATRIGWNQKGGSRFIHLGWSKDYPRGTWTY